MSRAASRRGRRETLEARALSLLRRLAGPGASFRDGHLEPIRAIVADRGRVLAVQRTGWGKSAVYLIGTRLMRDEGAGPTMLVSPLLALVHYQAPGPPIAYYQQVGRAGRAVDRAPAVLLRGREDEEIQDYFIRTAFPPRRQAEEVVRLLEERAEPVSINGIVAAVNVRKSRLEAMQKILEVEGAVERVEGKWRRTLRPWAYPEEPVARVTATRREEQAAMRAYGQEGCLMEFLRRGTEQLGLGT